MPDIRSKIVEVCIFSFKNGIPQYLLLKRSSADNLYPGIWQIVTGGIRENEKAFEAAYREMREETQLTAIHFYIGPHVSSFYDAKDDVVHLSPLFAAEVKPEDSTSLSDEHEEYRWCGYDEARTLLVWPAHRQGIDIVHEYIAGNKLAGSLLEISDRFS